MSIKLHLVPGDRVRNIRSQSGRQGWCGTVHDVERNRHQLRVKFDNGTSQCYLRQFAHVSLEKIESKCPCRREQKALSFCERYSAGPSAIKLDLSGVDSLLLEQMIEEAKRGTPTYILEAYYNELQITQLKRHTLKKVRRNVITGLTQDDMVKQYGPARGVEQFNIRALGRSTGQAFRIVGDAMCNPGQEIRISKVDHAREQPGCSTSWSTLDKHFREMVKKTIGDMKGFTFTDTHIVFNPIVTEETYVERH